MLAALSDLERLLRRERVPAAYTLQLFGFPPAARARLVAVLQAQRGLDESAADAALARLPLSLGGHWTRGQAEDVAEEMGRDGIKAQVCTSEHASAADG